MIDILQSYYTYADGVAAESGFLSDITTGGATLLMVIIGVVGYFVQARLQSVFKRYSAVAFPEGLTGAELAEKMLRDHGITDVKVTHTRGHLTDHFNPATKTVNLSDSVYSSSSIAAAAVACHECGHAVQHAEGYAPLRLRSQLVPIVNFASTAATWVIVAGIAILATTNSATVCWIGIAMIATSALFSIVTLPVEYNASERALAWLQNTGYLKGNSIDGARTSLRWAARTYLVAALSAIATLIYYIALINSRRR